MKVHHLNCGTMHPYAVPDGLVCHVLLVETDDGLALVDSGFGLLDGLQWKTRMGSTSRFLRPEYADAETAIRQVEALGYDPHDVRDIVLTHFDGDHIGGVDDFPWARVHLTADEVVAARARATLVEKRRYREGFIDELTVVGHSPSAAEPWRGFPAATELTDIAPGIVLIALPGHSRGHAAVAVDAGDHWTLHVGDSFYHHGQVDRTGGVPVALRVMESLVARDRARVRANHERLSELWAEHDADLILVNAHDPTLLRAAQVAAGRP
ncbi:MBL fold metallo-hydrolase [Gordonia sp. NB41Y]|uniref:MBL fold metallo-hydrolase n=1 Tax=Gordonia sp. NB41Y TaxID=875808 RepID=UPI00034C77B6|nr:MBL fold metallo-hydrolase [Gordonia sp. NB41Y]EMP14508.2 hypothetical protein ISGA_1206 [Gordonia sp. NB41Y]WLP91843.1 MBL fold metallo-hydrolase [Gordonia sp. NB41Y]